MTPNCTNCPLQFERFSLEAESDDFLIEEVIQALVQLSHDAVLLCVLHCRATSGRSLKKGSSRTGGRQTSFLVSRLDKRDSNNFNSRKYCSSVQRFVHNGHHLHQSLIKRDVQVGSVLSSLVWGGIWCDALELYVGLGAARPNPVM